MRHFSLASCLSPFRTQGARPYGVTRLVLACASVGSAIVSACARPLCIDLYPHTIDSGRLGVSAFACLPSLWGGDLLSVIQILLDVGRRFRPARFANCLFSCLISSGLHTSLFLSHKKRTPRRCTWFRSFAMPHYPGSNQPGDRQHPWCWHLCGVRPSGDEYCWPFNHSFLHHRSVR